MNVSLIKEKKKKKNSNRSKKNQSVCKYLLIMNMRIMEKGGRIFFVYFCLYFFLGMFIKSIEFYYLYFGNF